MKQTLLKQCLTAKNQQPVNTSNKYGGKAEWRLSILLQHNNHTESSPVTNSSSSDSVTLVNDNTTNNNDYRQSSGKGNGSSLLKSANINEKTIVNSKIIELLNRKASNSISARHSNNHKHQLSSPSTSHQQGKLSALESLLNSKTNCSDDELRDNQKQNQQVSTRNGNDNHYHQHKQHSKRPSQAVRLKSNQTATARSDELNSEPDLSDNNNVYSYSANGYLDPLETRTAKSFEKYDPITKNYANRHRGFIAKFDERYADTSDQNDFDQSEIDIEGSHVIPIRTLRQKDVFKLKNCFLDVAIPDNVRLGLRISQIASHDVSSLDSRVVLLCNIALKVYLSYTWFLLYIKLTFAVYLQNFVKNILSHLATARSSFLLHNNQIKHHIGTPLANPYLYNSHRTLANVASQNNPNGNELHFFFIDLFLI